MSAITASNVLQRPSGAFLYFRTGARSDVVFVEPVFVVAASDGGGGGGDATCFDAS